VFVPSPRGDTNVPVFDVFFFIRSRVVRRARFVRRTSHTRSIVFSPEFVVRRYLKIKQNDRVDDGSSILTPLPRSVINPRKLKQQQRETNGSHGIWNSKPGLYDRQTHAVVYHYCFTTATKRTRTRVCVCVYIGTRVMIKIKNKTVGGSRRRARGEGNAFYRRGVCARAVAHVTRTGSLRRRRLRTAVGGYTSPTRVGQRGVRRFVVVAVASPPVGLTTCGHYFLSTSGQNERYKQYRVPYESVVPDRPRTSSAADDRVHTTHYLRDGTDGPLLIPYLHTVSGGRGGGKRRFRL